MTMISPRTATFSGEGWTATVRMMSAVHQELQPEQNAACEDASDRPVDAFRTLASEQAECAAHQGCRQAHEDSRDAEDLHAPGYAIHGLFEAHLFSSLAVWACPSA